MMTISTYKQVTNLPRTIDKVVVVMGATGTGKSRLAIDLASIFSGEVINSDKIQVYKGLDVITNKVTDEERRGVPHHLLGIIDRPDEDFTAKDFVRRASLSAGDIVERGRLPIIAGGSNSFVEALVDNQVFRSKYECCFFWVDVSVPVLHSIVRKRVDHMVSNGLVAEAREFSGGDYSRGILRAIGVSEMDEFFKTERFVDGVTRAELLKAALDEIKENTCKLIHRQLEKIFMMGEKLKWREMHRLDATEAFLRRDEDTAAEAWQRSVVGPSARILSEFLGREEDVDDQNRLKINSDQFATSFSVQCRCVGQ